MKNKQLDKLKALLTTELALEEELKTLKKEKEDVLKTLEESVDTDTYSTPWCTLRWAYSVKVEDEEKVQEFMEMKPRLNKKLAVEHYEAFGDVKGLKIDRKLSVIKKRAGL